MKKMILNFIRKLLGTKYILENTKNITDKIQEFDEYKSDINQISQQVVMLAKKIDSMNNYINTDLICNINKLDSRIANIVSSEEIKNLSIIAGCIANSVSCVNSRAFAIYKNIYNGKDIVICGTGLTLESYNPIIKAIHIGLNGAMFFDKVKFDYLFYQDCTNRDKTFNQKFEDYKAIKFSGINIQNPSEVFYNLSNSLVKKSNAIRYYSLYNPPLAHIIPFSPDIANTPIKDEGSIAFIAFQFALYTNPKRIYLVGCDCNSGYFYDPLSNTNSSHLVIGWKNLKKFASTWYPDTEIISINPVGLKGLFNDIYTIDYTDSNYENDMKSDI